MTRTSLGIFRCMLRLRMATLVDFYFDQIRALGEEWRPLSEKPEKMLVYPYHTATYLSDSREPHPSTQSHIEQCT